MCKRLSCSEPGVFLFSGTRWAARSRPSTMSWRDASASCTCSSIRTGRREPTRPAPRRGSANKTPKTEVPPKVTTYMLLHYYILFCFFISNLRAVHITRIHLYYFFTFFLIIRPVAGKIGVPGIPIELSFREKMADVSVRLNYFYCPVKKRPIDIEKNKPLLDIFFGTTILLSAV